MRNSRNAARALFALSVVIFLLAGSSRSDAANGALDRATILSGTIDWVRQAGDEKIVPPGTCARLLILCGADGATFKFKSAKASGAIVRSFMWIGGRTVLLTQIKRRAIYFVLDPGGTVVRVVLVNLADDKERKIPNDDPAFAKLLDLEIKFWQAQTPNGQ